jgi:hypothetical protein
MTPEPNMNATAPYRWIGAVVLTPDDGTEERIGELGGYTGTRRYGLIRAAHIRRRISVFGFSPGTFPTQSTPEVACSNALPPSISGSAYLGKFRGPSDPAFSSGEGVSAVPARSFSP